MTLCDELEARQQKQQQVRVRLNNAALDALLTAREPDEFADHWQRICTNFDLLYDRPETIAKLRAAILQLAVQGKLVPQDPNDEPASVLLERIRAEKERLVREKKIRGSKNLPVITSAEVNCQLPDGWEWVRLGDLGYTQTGTTPSKKDAENFGDFVPFIGPGNIKKHIIDYSGEGLSEHGVSNGRLIEKNSVLMVCIGGSIGKHAINDRNISCNQQINTITPYNRDSEKYLFYAMGTAFFQETVLDKAGGSATPIINKQKWSSIPIPLPPASEQNRIAAKVEQLIGQCEKLEQQLIDSQVFADKLAISAVADAAGVKAIGDTMGSVKKKVKNGENINTEQVEVELTTKNFTLRNFSMSTGYRSLKKFVCSFHNDVDLNSEVSPICLVGLNGSGKSNLIEAFADVFCFLELINLPWKKTSNKSSRYKKNDHLFELEYDIKTGDALHEVVIKKSKKTGVEFYVRDENGALNSVPQGVEQLKLLPRRVIGYSSGLNETVSHPFFRTKSLYSEEVRDAAPELGAPISESKNVIDTRTLYMDYESNAAILICNYIFCEEKELSVFKEYARVKGVSSFNLRFNKKRAGKSGANSIVRLTSELDGSLKSFLYCADVASQYEQDRADYELQYTLDEKTKSRFRKEFISAENLFIAMHKWSLLNALVLSDAQRTVFLKEDVTKGTLDRPPSVPPKDRIFNIADLKLNLSVPDITIDYSGLSDGEHQFIQVFGTVLLFNEPGSLFLFDEPESHFNPEWRTKFNAILNVLPNAEFQEFMISTHSPFVVSGTRGCNVFKFERKEANVGCQPIDFETYGASFDFLLKKLFGIDSMIDQSARDELEAVIKEGDRDKMADAIQDFAESREKRRLYQALIEAEGEGE